MRHVTDGELHAFLDGALDLLPEHRGEEVRAHVSECSACRERLQDEESLRARAVEILGDPRVGSVELPTFEELRERAEARDLDPEGGAEIRYRGPLRGAPLAWAATVVLALGVGWMGGEIWHTLPRNGRDASSGSNVVNRDSVSPELEMARSRIEPSQEAPSPSSESGAGQDPASRSAITSPPVSRAATPKLISEDQVGAPPALDRVVAEGRSGDDTSKAPSPQFGLEEGIRTAPLRRELEEPALPDERSFAIPGLKLLSVEWEEWLPGERALRIRQLLSMGDTLELRYLGLLMGTEPKEGTGAPSVSPPQEDLTKELPLSPAVLEASLPPGWNQVEMRWGRGWLVARAPLPEESIKALLRSLR